MEPRVGGEELAELKPIIAHEILLHGGSVKPAIHALPIGHVKRINPIHAVAGNDLHRVGLQPIQLAFVRRVELVNPRPAGSHRVVNVAIFEVGSRPYHAGVGDRVPKIRVPKAVIVPQLMRRDAGAHALQPDTLATDVCQPAETIARHGRERDNVAVVICRIVTGQARRLARIGQQLPRANGRIPGLKLGQRHQRRHRRVEGGQVVGILHIISVHAVHR